MSSKPKKSAYKASETEKASASVAMAQYQRFKQKYDPLLQEMRNASTSEDPTNILRNRAAANTAQALTANLNLRGARSTTDAVDYTQGYLSQMGGATTQGKEIQGKLQANVLSIASQQGADAASGLAQAARTQTGVELSKLRDKQMVKNAKWDAVAGLAGSFMGQGMANRSTSFTNAAGQTTKGTFFTPVNAKGEKIKTFKQRINESGYFG